jgi:hypothetical protein
MISISQSEDFREVPRTKHIKKRLIKSRVLSKLLLSLSRGDLCSSITPFSRENICFIESLSSIQVSELACMLISDFSIDLAVCYELETNEFVINGPLAEDIAKGYIDEWVLSCSNDYRVIYDESSKGMPDGVLKKLIHSTPKELQNYAYELASNESISFEYDEPSVNKTIAKAKHLFKQDKLIINAYVSGASLPQCKHFFSRHRLCDSRSAAVIKSLYSFKECNKHIEPSISKIIADEFSVIENSYRNNHKNNEEFLSKLYNFLASILDRFDVSFSDSWSAIRNSTEKNTIRRNT